MSVRRRLACEKGSFVLWGMIFLALFGGLSVAFSSQFIVAKRANFAYSERGARLDLFDFLKYASDCHRSFPVSCIAGAPVVLRPTLAGGTPIVEDSSQGATRIGPFFVRATCSVNGPAGHSADVEISQDGSNWKNAGVLTCAIL